MKKLVPILLVLVLMLSAVGAAPTPEPEASPVVSDFFFDDDLRTEYIHDVKLLDFPALRDLIDEYIADEDPEATDPIYEISNLIDQAIEFMEACDREADDIEETARIYYSGVSEISSTVHMVPSLEGNHLRLLVGFTAEDWLHFDRVIIAADGEQLEAMTYSRSKIDADTLDGGMVREQILKTYSYSEPDLFLLPDAESAAIRFKNSGTDEILDFDLTADECEASGIIYALWEIQDALRQYNLDYFHANPVSNSDTDGGAHEDPRT